MIGTGAAFWLTMIPIGAGYMPRLKRFIVVAP